MGAVNNQIIRIANCIIPRPNDRSVVLSVKTVAFGDLSLPGKTITGNVDIERFLIDSVKEKTNIIIESFENELYEIAYEKNGQLFERSVLVVKECRGVPTTMGDREKYGIGVFRPDIIFTPDWQIRKEYLLAPGVRKTLLTYYADVDSIRGKYPSYAHLDKEHVNEICRAFEKV